MRLLLNTLGFLLFCAIAFISVSATASENMNLDKEMLELSKHDGYIELIKLNDYLRKGADIFARDKDGMSAIHLAARYNTDPKVIEILADFGADINKPVESADTVRDGTIAGTPLYYALCYNPNYKVIETILRLQQDKVHYPAYTLLALAARNPNEEIVNNMYEQLLNELLLAAAINVNTKVIERFIKLGADVNADYEEGTVSPLYVAVKANNARGVNYLLSEGADLGVKYAANRSIILVAAGNSIDRNTSKIINNLVMYGCYLNEIDEDGNTPLHLAVRRATELYEKGYQAYPLSVIEELINLGADITIRNFAGDTALDIARKHQENSLGEENLADEVMQILRQAQQEREQRLADMQACG